MLFKSIVLRPAEQVDINSLYQLLKDYADRNAILPRSLDNIQAHFTDFNVAWDQETQTIIGCAAVHQYSASLAEIRSLVVLDNYQGQGLGRQLVLFTEQCIRDREIPRVFVLTRSVAFFSRLGYQVVDKQLFPEKIWKDCQACPLLDACDEIAMQKILK